jgi:hypothetical protein
MRFFIGSLLCILCTNFAVAEWRSIVDENDTPSHQNELYVDLSNIKQSGPMATYRQVKVLNQTPGRDQPNVASTLSVYEYDCQHTKLRILSTAGFTKKWAQGEAIVLPVPPQVLQWNELPASFLGQKTFDQVCFG